MSVFEIELYGKLVAKKNHKVPVVRNGKAVGMFYANRGELDSLMLQVPGDLRDLNLVHPDIEFFFEVPDGRSDRDNMATTALDLLVKTGVLQNDSIAQCNGLWTIHPATVSPDGSWKTRIVLSECLSADMESRQITPTPKRRTPKRSGI